MLRPQLMVSLPNHLRWVWRDRLANQDNILVRVVRPSPLADQEGTRRLHFIVEVNRPERSEVQPLLFALRQITQDGVEEPWWCADLFPTRLTVADVHRICQPQCEMHQLLIPIGGNLRRWMSPYNDRVVTWTLPSRMVGQEVANNKRPPL